MRRRSFLKFSAAAAGVASLPAASATAASIKPRIQHYVPLGRTGIEVSDVSFGGSRLNDASLVSYAYDRGVTYFDTAESYRGGDSETAMGRVLSKVRDKVVIASKTKAWDGQHRGHMMDALEQTLRRLRTDYVDIYYNHAVNARSRMENPEWAEFTERAKEQGKIRFRGMSGHGSKLVQCLDYSIDQDLVDVVLVSFNFAQDPDFADQVRHLFHYVALQPDLSRVLQKAREQGVGVVAMKTLMGARLNDMRQYESPGTTFAQAALKWVLASGYVDVALISMTDYEEIDEYIYASGSNVVSETDFRLLAQYVSFQGSQYCQQGCGICLSACPQNVPISDVLRVRMYDVDYNDVQLAQSGYNQLGLGASPCLNCADQPCIGRCPNNIPIAALTRDAAVRFAKA